MINQNLAPRSGARGFSLVEVLVALLVISIGMLGLAALYVETLRMNRTAIYRTQAVNLASDMAERIRANAAAGVAYAGAGADSGCNDGAGVAVACTPIQMAAQDVFDWQQTTAGLLPNGNAALVFVAAGGGAPNVYTLTITWTEVSQADALTFVMTVEA
ncbi:MAG: type IV pilus modification protein PilV [Gammaproteobacteria bacterium]|nr:type IV pilus modification protein PilV [Gammaproteobacteria bacterium]